MTRRASSRELRLCIGGPVLRRCAKHEVVRAILDQGVDVRQSSRDIYSKMVEAEMLSVKDYVEVRNGRWVDVDEEWRVM